MNITKQVRSLEKLKIFDSRGFLPDLPDSITPRLQRELKSLYNNFNGFSAFGGAMHCFPSKASERTDITSWNKNELWKNRYPIDLKHVLCFAQSIIGDQYCIVGEKVGRFDPETGDVEAIGTSLKEWFDVINEETDFATGRPLLLEREENNGLVPDHSLLIPKIPFVCGGQFSVDNVVAVEAVRAMRIRGGIASQIHGHPDGTVFEFSFDE
ncbi:SMI1/KNR4 family protein [Stratiformator vulcanicus]|uniref:SMI1 / KNR4 family protein n=1 Tax=Stratiformator vulcanicus TaxID=2527980 RepID=A0A517R5U5_9PLAN|nr:SMI1/KNR4 family protein [Stratiformator vulcanicus]QDT39258.1 hypothetical protein Pan189_36620 [Stratiformator vulcanicus]